MKAAPLLAIALLCLAAPLQAQAPFAVISAKAEYVNPPIDENFLSYMTPDAWAAAGYNAVVSAEAHDTAFSPPQNVAKSSASLFQGFSGNAVARQYAYTGAYYHVGTPVESYAASEISSQWQVTITPLIDQPFLLKGFMPIHGILSARESSQATAASAIAYATTGIRLINLDTGGDVTFQGEIWARNSLGPEEFTVQTNGIFSGFTTLRDELTDPEGLYTGIKVVELSNLLVYDLPDVLPEFVNSFEVTFFQKVSAGLLGQVDGKMAFANFNNTTEFGFIAVDPQTGLEIPNAIRVTIFPNVSGAAAPEPGTAGLLVVGLGTIGIVLRRRARQ